MMRCGSACPASRPALACFVHAEDNRCSLAASAFRGSEGSPLLASVTVIRSIQAPAEAVFEVLADPDRFAQAISGVTQLEVLSGMRSGVGTRYRQSRTMNGKESVMEFEVTEHVKNERLRILNETHGTVWDSLFTLAPIGSSTTLTMRMEARSRRLIPRMLLPMICLLIRKAVEKDIDAVKVACERLSGDSRSKG